MRRILDERYELLVEINTGALGRLYYSWDRHRARPVAIRAIRPALDSSFSDTRLVELDQAARLDHPHIARVFELRRDAQGICYVVSSFVDGIDLRTVLDRLSGLGKRLPDILTWLVIDDMLQALTTAHDPAAGSPVCHGALAPERVLIDASGRVILTGFVSARLVADGRIGGANQRRWGEPSAASELAPKDERQAIAADLKAVCWILYELLTGDQSPAAGREFRRIGSGSLSEEGEHALHNSKLPSAVRAFIGRALAPGRPRRHASAAAMRQDLLTAIGGSHPDGARAQLALVTQGLLSPEEREQRRRLVALRGGVEGPVEAIETDGLRPTKANTPSVAAGDDETTNVGLLHTESDQEKTTGFRYVRPADPQGEVVPSISPVAARRPVSTQSSRGSNRSFRMVAMVGVLAIIVIAVWLLFDRPGSGTGENATSGGVSVDSLYLESIPTHAKLFINDEYAGTTPFAYESFESGPLKLTFRMLGLAPVETLLIVRDNEPPPVFDPFVFRTRVTFSSIPAGGRPIVNGRRLRDFEALGYEVAAQETVSVAFDLRGARSPVTAYFSPLAGLVPPTDTTFFRWIPPSDKGGAELIGVFARSIRFHSQPPGALVYLDGDSVPVGKTNTSIDITFGDHTAHLQKQPFFDYRFSFTVSNGTPDIYAPVLRRTVRIDAVDADDPSQALNASIRWIRLDNEYVRTPDDNLVTPYSLPLDGRPHEIHLAADHYDDTTVILAPEASELTVAMRRVTEDEEGEGRDTSAWVRFVVRAGRRDLISGAEVIGIEKETGDIVRYGLTDADGELLTRVPLGDYDWQASKAGYESKPNGERISASRRTKRITLDLRPL